MQMQGSLFQFGTHIFFNQLMRIIDGKTSTQKLFQSQEVIKRLPIFQVFENNLSFNHFTGHWINTQTT
jgi:hypothetical protein